MNILSKFWHQGYNLSIVRPASCPIGYYPACINAASMLNQCLDASANSATSVSHAQDCTLSNSVLMHMQRASAKYDELLLLKLLRSFYSLQLDTTPCQTQSGCN